MHLKPARSRLIAIGLILNFICQNVLSVKEIGAPCDPTAFVSECGKNAFCFRVPACQLGVCLCRTPRYRQLYFKRIDCGLVLNEGDDCSNADPGVIPVGAVCLNVGRVKCVQLLMSADGVCAPKTSQLRKIGEECGDEATTKCDIYDGLRCSIEQRCECLPSYQLAKSETKCHLAKLGEWCQTDDECNAPYAIASAGGNIKAARCRPENSLTPTCNCNASGNFTAVQYSLFDPYETPPNSRLITIGRYCVQMAPTMAKFAEEGEECSIAIPQQAPLRRRLIPPPICKQHLLCYHCPEFGNVETLVGKCFDPRSVLESASTSAILLLQSSLRTVFLLNIFAFIYY